MAVRIERRNQDRRRRSGARRAWPDRSTVASVWSSSLAACVAADFRRVNAGADCDDRFLGRGEPPRLVGRQRARIGQALVGRANLVEVADVFRRADDGGDRAVALGGRAEVDQLRRDRIARRPARSIARCASAVASRRSVPMRKPKCSSGDGDLRRDRQRRADGRWPARQPPTRKSFTLRMISEGDECRAMRSSRPGVTPVSSQNSSTTDVGRAPPARCRAARRVHGRERAALLRSPAAAAASTYSSTTDGISRGAKAWRSSSASMGM